MDVDLKLKGSYPGSLPLNRRAKEVLEEFLFDGETLLWCDKPQARWSQFVRSLIPAVIGLVVIIFSVVSAFIAQLRSSAHAARAFQGPLIEDDGTWAVYLIIVIMGLLAVTLLVWGRPMFLAVGGNRLINIFYTSSTCYGLTNRRLLVIVGKSSTLGLSVNLKYLENLRLCEESDGFGSINFERWLPHANPFRAENLPPLIFRNIANVAQVFRLIAEAQNDVLNTTGTI